MPSWAVAVHQTCRLVDRVEKKGTPLNHPFEHMFPVRCYTCNAPVAKDADRYSELAGTASSLEAFRGLGIHRVCCRRMFLGHVDITKDFVNFPNTDVVLDGSTVLRRSVTIQRTVSCD